MIICKEILTQCHVAFQRSHIQLSLVSAQNLIFNGGKGQQCSRIFWCPLDFQLFGRHHTVILFYQNQSSKTDLLLEVKPGMFCCAQFSEDDSWYRARITESSTKDTSQVQVIYVDFGNYESLPMSRLRILRKEHAELPMMAVLCALDGAVPSGGVRL